MSSFLTRSPTAVVENARVMGRVARSRAARRFATLVVLLVWRIAASSEDMKVLRRLIARVQARSRPEYPWDPPRARR